MLKFKNFALLVWCGVLGLLLWNCSTSTIPADDEVANGLALGSKKDLLVTDQVEHYFSFDTTHNVLYYHHNGMCYLKNGAFVWMANKDNAQPYYDYKKSGDTLYFYADDQLMKTYWRETNEGGSLEGRWVLDEEERETLTPHYLEVSGIYAVEKFSIKANAVLTKNKVFPLMIQDVVASQDGTVHPHRVGSEYTEEDQWAPDWEMVFGSHGDLLMDDDELFELCEPCEASVRTENSVAFTRKGKKIELSMENVEYNELLMNFDFNVTVDGKTCVYHAECVSSVKSVCLSGKYSTEGLIDNHAYVAMTNENMDEFLKCYRELF